MEAKDKTPEKSLLRQLFQTETAIFLVGIGCMVYGVVDGIRVMPLFFGLCIVGGSVMLHFVRKKDWDAHWSDMDRICKEHELRMAEEKEKEKEKKG
jgi:flagellar biosynthesis component FlhA